MANTTGISYTDSTQSFWVGCSRVSPGCSNCWAEQLDKRHLHEPISHWGKGAPRYKCKGAVKSLLAMNRKPWICDQCGMAHSNATVEGWENTGDQRGIFCAGCNGITTMHRRKVFINQQADWLDPEVPIEWLAEMLGTIRQCPELDIMLLTKRPELWDRRVKDATNITEGEKMWLYRWCMMDEPPANIMLGTTVEDQKRADERIPELLKIPAKFRFLSVEPQLEDIVLPKLDGIHLLINGGESGSNACRFNLAWARNLRDQCKQAGVKFYFKQAGSNVRDYLEPGRPDRGMVSMRPYIKDRSGANPAEWPADLRVQEPFAIERL